MSDIDPRVQDPIKDTELVKQYIDNGWDYNCAIALTRRACKEWPEQFIITTKVIKRAA